MFWCSGVATPDLYLESLLTHGLLDYLVVILLTSCTFISNILMLTLVKIVQLWCVFMVRNYAIMRRYLLALFGRLCFLPFKALSSLLFVFLNETSKINSLKTIIVIFFEWESWTQKCEFVFLGFIYTLMRCSLMVLRHFEFECWVNFVKGIGESLQGMCDL